MEDIIDEILRLKKERKAIILAHLYQPQEIQEIADYTGDSFGLSRQAAGTDAEVIVFCGVKFMAETANILAPDKITLLPAADATCRMFTDSLTGEVAQLRKDVDELKAGKAEKPEAAKAAAPKKTAAKKPAGTAKK